MSQSYSCDIPRMETWELFKEGHDNSFLDISSYPQVVCIFKFLLYKMFKFLKLLDTYPVSSSKGFLEETLSSIE